MQFKTIALRAFCISIYQSGSVTIARTLEPRELKSWDLSPDGELLEARKISIKNVNVVVWQN